MIKRNYITLLGLLFLGAVCQSDVLAQDVKKDQRYLKFETRSAASGRIDMAEGTWRAKYRLNKDGERRTALRLLEEEAAAFGWSEDLRDLELVSEQVMPASTHITYQQKYQGLPVEGRFVRVNLDRDDNPTMILSGYKYIPEDTEFTPSPAISVDRAIELVKTSVEDPNARVQTPELVIMAGDGPVLAWKTITWPSDRPAEFVVLVDAATGELLMLRNEAISLRGHSKYSRSENGAGGNGAGKSGPVPHAPALPIDGPESASDSRTSVRRVDGSGYVYDPDPLTETGVTYGPPFVDAGDATNAQLDAARSLVTLRDITLNNQGEFVLEGPFVQIVGANQSNVTTYSPPTAISPDGFAFNRDHDGFEAVNAYYHIDQSQRYVQSFGITDRQNLPIEVNPLGFTNDDSFYFPNRNFLIFGSGGVDDAEDASVVWHEYGHALLNAAVPGLLSSLEGTALHEGWADYWTASYARHLWETGAVLRSDWERVFRWDSGDGAIWNGRVLDHTGSYPESTCSDDPSPVNCSPHNDGRLWATVLMEIYDDVGRAVLDEIVLRSHSYLVTPVTFRDAAEAVIQADLDYFGGAHLSTLLNRFGARGLVNAGSFAPTVFHDPLPWTEELGGTVMVSASVIGISAPVSDVVMKYSTMFGENMTLPLVPVGGDQYEGELQLPLTPDTVSYYIEATDTGSRKGFVPAMAPVDVYSFGVGPDTEAPELTHTPFENIPLVTWPPLVEVVAEDNLGMDHVKVSYVIEGADAQTVAAGDFILSGSGNTYSGIFPVDSGTLPQNVLVYYSIEGVDAAIAANSTRLPQTGDYEFRVRSEGVIRSFDFEVETTGLIKSGIWEVGEPAFGLMSARTGQKVVGTSLDTAYPEAAQKSVLELPRVNLDDVTNGLLVFWHWFDTEHDGTADPSETGNQVWDGGNVEYSIDGGASWNLITPENGYNGIVAQSQGNPISTQPAFGGYSYGWRQVIAPLPEASDVRIRFNFGTDISNIDIARYFAGWYLDDIRITTERPIDSGFPASSSLPPNQATYSIEQSQPVITGYFSDDNGVTDVYLDYTYSTATGESSGTLRMEQDVTVFARYSGTMEFLTDPRPSESVRYSIRVLDYSGNGVVYPSDSDQFEINYELIEQSEITNNVSVSGIWQEASFGWSTTGEADPFSFISAINFFPIDLPENSTTIEFSMLHNYTLASDFGGNVKISTDGGDTWGVLEPLDGYTGNLELESFHLMNGEPGFVGPSGISAPFNSVFELSEFAGSQVWLRIDLATPRAAKKGEMWQIESTNLKISTDQNQFDISRAFQLHQAYPNPFDVVTHIGFTIEQAGPIELSVYDILGRRVELIADGFFEEGSYERSLSAHNLSAGLYIVRLQSRGISDSHTIIVTN